MLTRLVQFALSQRIFILLGAALLAGFGWYAFRNLPIDAFPDVSSTQVKVILKAPGMTPEEVESRIVAPPKPPRARRAHRTRAPSSSFRGSGPASASSSSPCR